MHRVSLLLVVLLAASAGRAETPVVPGDVLAELLADPASTDATLSALAAAGDKELLPLFALIAQRDERPRRLLAVAAAAKLGGADAAGILYDRVRNDTAGEIRSEALTQLIALDAISDAQLTELLASDDTMLQCQAARELVRRGRGGEAFVTLRNLARSNAPVAANLARLTLLATGEMEHLAPLAELLRDPDTSSRLRAVLLRRIADERVAPAADVARQVAETAEAIPMKVLAYRAAALAGANGPTLLAEAITASDQTVLRVQLLHNLAELPGAAEPLRSLADGDDAVARLARFELSRLGQGQPLEKTARQALAVGHAVVVDYVLDRARGDLTADATGTDDYTDALITIIHLAPVDSPEMLPEHIQAAQAAELLGELANSRAAAEITAILNGPFNARSRAVAGGLLRCRNPAVCPWMAPLLASPYEELANDAALTLGGHGDARAAYALAEILRHRRRHPPELLTLAGWTLAKLTGRGAQTVSALCQAAP